MQVRIRSAFAARMHQSWRKRPLMAHSSNEGSQQSPLRRSQRSSFATLVAAASPTVASCSSMPPMGTGPRLRLRSRRSQPVSPALGRQMPNSGADTSAEKQEARRGRASVNVRAKHFLSKLKVRSKGAQRHFSRCVNSFKKSCAEKGYVELLENEPSSHYVDEAME